MPTNFASRPRRLAAALLLASALSAPLALPVLAGPGHDHGAPAATAAAGPATPTVQATGTDVELVGMLRDGALVLYIDRYRDNSPVTDAGVTIAVAGGKPVAAIAQADGTYRADAAWATPGEHALTITVTGTDIADLLIGTLGVVEAAEADGHEHGHGPLVDIAIATGALLGGLGVGALLVRRRRGPALAVAGLALAVAAGPPPDAGAHEGHDHGGAPAVVSGDAPQRLPDGSLFVPKPTQRLLGVRTMVLATDRLTPSQTLPGRVIADPNRSGRVQAAQSGRLMPPDTGFPLVGERVVAGQVLGYVELQLQAADRGSVTEQLAGLEKEIVLARQELVRVEKLAGTVSQKTIDDARATLAGLQRQRGALDKALARRVPLTAPVDGVVASSTAAAGQMIEDRDVAVLFEIVDPAALMVEALAFDKVPVLSADRPASVRINGADHALRPAGQGPSRLTGAVPLLFRLDPAVKAGIGEVVTVTVPLADEREGLILPREALVRGGDGLPTLFVHEGPQQFVPHAVRVVPAGATHVQILDGIGADERVVVRGAELLNQIR